MKKKLLHKVVGVVAVIGCCSSVMAADTSTALNNNEVVQSVETKTEVESEIQDETKSTEVTAQPEVKAEETEAEEEATQVEAEKAEVSEKVEVTAQPEAKATEEKKAESTETTQKPVVEKKVSTGEKVVNYAKQFIGTPYVSGGNNLSTGVDCSGFTQQVYKHFGVNLERTSRSQYACNGYAVSKSNLKEGDLVFYGYSSVCHVAIYVGDGQVIHAPVPGRSVCIVPLWQRGDAPIIGYKRIFND